MPHPNFLAMMVRAPRAVDLLEQSEGIRPDAMSWFQLGAAHAGLGQSDNAIQAYEKALALDPEYDLAMFNLGGVRWNSGDRVRAMSVWKTAITRFPDHELAAKLRRDLPGVLSPDPHV